MKLHIVIIKFNNIADHTYTNKATNNFGKNIK